jgi:hypothetical protein
MLPCVLAQDLVVYCNATQNQYYGNLGMSFNIGVYSPAHAFWAEPHGLPQFVNDTYNAISCCLRCAFSNTCNIWCALPLGMLPSVAEVLPALLAELWSDPAARQCLAGIMCFGKIAWHVCAPHDQKHTSCLC